MITEGLQEFEGNLIQHLYDIRSNPDKGLFLKSKSQCLLEMFIHLSELNRNFIENLLLVNSPPDGNKFKKGLIEINKISNKIFLNWVDLLILYNFDPERLIDKLNQHLEELNFKEVFGSEENPLFTLFNYCNHLLIHEGINQRSILGYNILSHYPELNKMSFGYVRYSDEILNIHSSLLMGCFNTLSQLPKLENQPSSQEYHNFLETYMIDLSLSVFSVFTFNEINEDRLAVNYRSYAE